MKTKLLVMLLALSPLLVVGQTSTISRYWHCPPPTTGSQVTDYHWELNTGSVWTPYATTAVESVTINISPNVVYTVRVRAGDAQGHLGPWSPVSLPDQYTSPGGCGLPWVTK